MNCKDGMTRNPCCCLPTDRARRAAQVMKTQDVGAVVRWMIPSGCTGGDCHGP